MLKEFEKKYLHSLSHQNATCKLGGKLNHFVLRKINKLNTKCYTYFWFFHRRSIVIPFRMKIVEHACYTNKNIYKKNQNF